MKYVKYFYPFELSPVHINHSNVLSFFCVKKLRDLKEQNLDPRKNAKNSYNLPTWHAGCLSSSRCFSSLYQYFLKCLNISLTNSRCEYVSKYRLGSFVQQTLESGGVQVKNMQQIGLPNFCRTVKFGQILFFHTSFFLGKRQ